MMYSPYESCYYKVNIKNGKFTNTGGGFQINLQWEHKLSWGGEMKTTLGYKKTGNKLSTLLRNIIIMWPVWIGAQVTLPQGVAFIPAKEDTANLKWINRLGY